LAVLGTLLWLSSAPNPPLPEPGRVARWSEGISPGQTEDRTPIIVVHHTDGPAPLRRSVPPCGAVSRCRGDRLRVSVEANGPVHEWWSCQGGGSRRGRRAAGDDRPPPPSVRGTGDRSGSPARGPGLCRCRCPRIGQLSGVQGAAGSCRRVSRNRSPLPSPHPRDDPRSQREPHLSDRKRRGSCACRARLAGPARDPSGPGVRRD